MIETSISARTRWQFQTAMILAISADALQLFVMPLFAEGALSPADDVLDVAMRQSWCACLDGIGSFCPRSRRNSYRESI